MSTSAAQPGGPGPHSQRPAAVEVDERLAALVGNTAAVAAIASAVEGTLGPKGLNTMLVDRFGDVTITNDGSTILEKMDVSHPAARLVINAARAQDREVGDGTTTTTLLASALLSEAVGHVRRGVPVTRLIEGIGIGVAAALATYSAATMPVSGPDDPLLWQCALIAGREDPQIARLAVEAARAVPPARLMGEDGFKLADLVLAKEGARPEVAPGLVLDKERMNRQMPEEVAPAVVLVMDDALEPEAIEEAALGTEAGFREYVRLQEEFRAGLETVLAAGVNALFVARAISDQAEDLLTSAGVLAVRRLGRRDIARVCEHTGARPLKRSALNRPAEEILAACGRAERVAEDQRLGHIRVLGGAGEPTATLLIGAATREVREEQQRIAADACAAVQAALRGGVLPGGGAIEIAAARAARAARDTARGMAAYGVDCVIEALKRVLGQIVANAGFNPLEKVEDVVGRQSEADCAALAVDCDSGEICDMLTAGVLDAAPVKVHALQAAREIAEAVLRINIVIRKRDENPGAPPQV
jgi:archaeal chaperonin